MTGDEPRPRTVLHPRSPSSLGTTPARSPVGIRLQGLSWPTFCRSDAHSYHEAPLSQFSMVQEYSSSWHTHNCSGLTTGCNPAYLRHQRATVLPQSTPKYLYSPGTAGNPQAALERKWGVQEPNDGRVSLVQMTALAQSQLHSLAPTDLLCAWPTSSHNGS